MKKLVAFLLALLVATLPLSAMAAPGDATICRNDDGSFGDWIGYSTVDGDTLYLAGDQGMYLYHVGDAEPEKYVWDESRNNADILIPDWEYADSGNLNEQALFVLDGQCYMLVSQNYYTEEASGCSGAILVKVNLADGVASVEAVDVALDYGLMIEEYDTYSYPRSIECSMSVNGKLYLMAYSNSGDYMIVELDPATGELRQLENVKDMQTVVPYKDGQLLVQQFSYEKPNEVVLAAYDPATESSHVLTTLTVEEYSYLIGMAYCADTDLLYYVEKGMLMSMNMEDQTVAEVTDMPGDIYGNRPGMILGDSHYVYNNYSATTIRNLDPTLKAEIFLKINDNSYSEAVTNAYYTYGNTRATAVIYNDYLEDSKILENMMNRVADPDIYIMEVSRQAYSAIRNRGYMADMNGSEKITALVDQVYDGFKDELIRDGDYVAVPVRMYGNTLGVNASALEKLGLTIDDVPTNWNDLLDWMIEDLPGLMPEDGSVCLFYSDQTVEDAKYEMFSAIFNAYCAYLDAEGWDRGFNTPELRELLGKLEQVDFLALGALEESPYDEEYGYIGVYRDTTSLLETYTSYALGSMYSSSQPLCMGLNADAPRLLQADFYVAFINPFTQHYEEAVQFMEAIADNVDTQTLMCMIEGMDEPVENQYYEENLKWAQEWLDDCKQQLENATDEDRQALEENLKYAEENLAYSEKDKYSISPEQIAWYRDIAQYIRVEQYNALRNSSEGTSEELYELIQQYTKGTISAETMLSGIDKKVQMMILEDM